jgi:zinc protease
VRLSRVAIGLCALLLALPKGGQLHSQQAGLLPGSPIPTDPNVTIGRLENGLTYYIRANERPEQRAELRLVIDVGSILEDEDQRGLAHVLEHMAFNGTRNFERQELVRYLESIGMRFGPDVNASTSFDETIYMLTVPTDDPEIVATAFQILEDWASGIVFDPEEIDKERDVVIEEWRGRRGAGARVQDQ